MPTLADHALVVVLVVVVPLYASAFSWPRMKRRPAGAGSATRVRTYWLNVALLWLLAAGAFAAWWYGRRPLAELGFGFSAGWGFSLAAGLALLLVAGLAAEYVVILRTEDGRRRMRDELNRKAAFTPRTRREMGHFTALAVTAGFTEEVLYRGFLIWYVTRWTGTAWTGLTAAVILAAIAFGVSHLYQGVKGAAQVFALAVISGALYVLSECLWIVIVMHVSIDIAGGLVSLAVNRTEEDEEVETRRATEGHGGTTKEEPDR